MKITTNNVPRDIIDATELTAAERSDFDYLDWLAIDNGTDSASFVRYKGYLHDLGTFERTSIPGWEGIHVDSMSTGVVLRHADPHGDTVIVGYVCA